MEWCGLEAACHGSAKVLVEKGVPFRCTKRSYLTRSKTDLLAPCVRIDYHAKKRGKKKGQKKVKIFDLLLVRIEMYMYKAPTVFRCLVGWGCTVGFAVTIYLPSETPTGQAPGVFCDNFDK